MSTQLTTERLREIKETSQSFGWATQDESKAMAAELLAKREECEAVGRHRDQLLELARLDNETAREAVLSGRENKFRFGAMTTRDAIAEVVQQRDAARTEVEKLRARLREANQTIVACIGASGPDAAEEAAKRAVEEIVNLRAELDAIRGRDAEPFDWDGVPTVEEWIAENLRVREPRAGSAMVELHPDEVVADRGESRRVAGWLKDLLAELAAWRSLGTEGEPVAAVVERLRHVMEEHAQLVSCNYEAELDAVKRQRDELRATAAVVIEERRYQKDTEMHDNYTDQARSRDREWKALNKLVALAASQPAQQPKPEVQP